MYIVRDRSRGGAAVSWGTDRARLDEIVASNTAFEIWPDLNASNYYWHFRPRGLNWVHPYDADAAANAPIKP